MPSLVLGTGEVSLLDMASGYSTFTANGEHVDPLDRHPRSTDASGRVLYEAPTKRERVDPQDVTDQRELGAQPGRPRAAPAPAPTSASRRRARRAPPRTTRTPGSSATRAKLTAAVWMGYPGAPATADHPAEAVAAMTNVHGQKVSGGTLPRADLAASSWPRPPRTWRAARSTARPT